MSEDTPLGLFFQQKRQSYELGNASWQELLELGMNNKLAESKLVGKPKTENEMGKCEN